MNKPLKLLLVIGVLAFAAAGLYYATIKPDRQTKAERTPPRREQSSTAFEEGNPRPPAEVTDIGPARQPEVERPAVPPTQPSPAQASATPTSGSTPPGFSPAAEPMKPLPSALPGFEPVKTEAPTPTASTVPSSTVVVTPPASGAAQPASPVPAATAASDGKAPTATSPAPAPAPLPPLPAPAKPAATTVPQTPTATRSAPRADTYTVKEGDSLVTIWRSLAGTERGWEKLLAANPGVDPTRLKIGQVLKVPETGAPAAPASTPASRPAAASASTYTVESGDTLTRIAAKTLGDGKRWKEIFEANRDKLGNDPGALEVGQVLRIPGRSAATDKPASKPAETSTKPAPASAPSGVIGGSSPSGSPAPR